MTRLLTSPKKLGVKSYTAPFFTPIAQLPYLSITRRKKWIKIHLDFDPHSPCVYQVWWQPRCFTLKRLNQWFLSCAAHEMKRKFEQ